MKKTLLQRFAAAFLIFALIFTAVPFVGGFEANAAAPTQKQVYKKLVSMKSKYPEGKSWNDFEHTYSNEYDNGSGCYAFALKMSDAAFGKELPYTEHKNLKELKVGDIINISNYAHYVVVLKIRKNSITIVEGNYGGRIHWNRKLSLSDLKKDKHLTILTRYYWKGLDFKETTDSVELSWPKLTKSQRKKIGGIAVVRNGEVIKRLKKTATSYSDTSVKYCSTNVYQLKTYKKVKKNVTMYWNKKTGKWQEKKIKNAKTKTVKKIKYKYSHAVRTPEIFFMGGEDF